MGLFFRAIRWIYERPTRVLSRVFASFCAARVVIIEDGKLAAVDQGAYLELPGGAVDHGETFEEAARREVEEETGLEAENLEFIEEKSWGAFVERIFAAEVEETDTEGSWEGEPVWIEIEEAPERSWRYSREVQKLVKKTDF